MAVVIKGHKGPPGARTLTPRKVQQAVAQPVPSSARAAILDRREQLALRLDELNGALDSVERALKELDLKVSASVTIDTDVALVDGVERPAITHDLAFMNGPDGWGLYVSRETVGRNPDDAEVVRLSRAPRAYRVRAVDFLDDLWAQLLERAKAEDVRIQRQTKRALAFAARLRGEAGGE